DRDAHGRHARREAAQEARRRGRRADPDRARGGLPVLGMTRIRIALALVSLAVLGLVGLLAWRANQGLAAERAVRHEAVAERAFEEIERALSEFLAREEGRPFEHYAYVSPATGERSPLASGLEPFVVGAFQIDPEGVVTTPLDEPSDAGQRVRAAVEFVRRSPLAAKPVAPDEFSAEELARLPGYGIGGPVRADSRAN